VTRAALGIHLGHDCACAVVAGGELIAAVQLERLSRRKHDACWGLSNRLPVAPVLAEAGVAVDELGAIVSCFQGASPGGVGLTRGIVDDDFRLFDPFDPRHHVVSHHLAHAASAVGGAGWDEAAVVVCDLGGSSTRDGEDFDAPFAAWYAAMTQDAAPAAVVTEACSFYAARGGELQLLARELVVPHNQPESFVHSVASLYDNVARAVFGRENAHGELMGLAAFGGGGEPAADDLVEVDRERVAFRNDWQHTVAAELPFDRAAALARACQQATERSLVAYARRARRLSGARRLAVAGGVFLNIASNSAIARSGAFDEVYVPSAPHDAGIAVGCAFLGDRLATARRRGRALRDRVGRRYGAAAVEAAMAAARPFVERRSIAAEEVAARLARGEILGRWHGRAEFGPRALGGRSLLASPLRPGTKAALNALKGRQAWRPLAPIVLEQDFASVFAGPTPSPYMSFAHVVRPEHRAGLPALGHRDGTTRAQTLDPEEDPPLAEILRAFARLTGCPVLVNTSLNGRGEPIVEEPREAVDFLLAHDGLHGLLLDGDLVTRTKPWERPELDGWVVRLAPGVVVSELHFARETKSVLSLRGFSCELSPALRDALARLRPSCRVSDLRARTDDETLYALLARRVLVPEEEEQPPTTARAAPRA
jgi:carbamoyltransferase